MALRERTRLKAERHADPTAAVLDRQAARPAKRGARGYDGHKKQGRKRHALVDTFDLLLGVRVLPANQTDRSGGAPCRATG